jgi:septal ring factor EnvC (AmiA/AmiB activator)
LFDSGHQGGVVMSNEVIIEIIGGIFLLAAAILSYRSSARKTTVDAIAVLVKQQQEDIKSLREDNRALRAELTETRKCLDETRIELASAQRRIRELEDENGRLRQTLKELGKL